MWATTLLVFTSDNGGPAYEASNYPLRAPRCEMPPYVPPPSTPLPPPLPPLPPLPTPPPPPLPRCFALKALLSRQTRRRLLTIPSHRRLEVLAMGGWPARHLVRGGWNSPRESAWNQAEHHRPSQRLVRDLLRARGNSADRLWNAGRPDQWSGWALAVATTVGRRGRRHARRDTPPTARGQTAAPQKYLLV